MWARCTHCGEWHEITEMRDSPPLEIIIQAAKLSPVAAAILQNQELLPAPFLRDKPVSLRVLGGLLGYSYEHVRKGLLELAEFGLIQIVEFGQARRKRYAGSSSLARVTLAVT